MKQKVMEADALKKAEQSVLYSPLSVASPVTSPVILQLKQAETERATT